MLWGDDTLHRGITMGASGHVPAVFVGRLFSCQRSYADVRVHLKPKNQTIWKAEV
jgi:hypothetical protein